MEFDKVVSSASEEKLFGDNSCLNAKDFSSSTAHLCRMPFALYSLPRSLN